MTATTRTRTGTGVRMAARAAGGGPRGVAPARDLGAVRAPLAAARPGRGRHEEAVGVACAAMTAAWAEGCRLARAAGREPVELGWPVFRELARVAVSAAAPVLTDGSAARAGGSR